MQCIAAILYKIIKLYRVAKAFNLTVFLIGIINRCITGCDVYDDVIQGFPPKLSQFGL